jgi:hypothetical protein
VLIDAGTGAAVRRARVDVIAGVPRIATVISNGRMEVMPGSSPITTVMSDDEGHFAVDVPASTQATVRVSKARYAPVTRTLSALQLRDSVPLLLALTPGAAIVGRVVDTAGEPVANVPILVLEGGAPGELLWGYSATAAAEGAIGAPATVSNLGSPISDGDPFTFSSLAGPMRLRFSSDDENWYLKAVTIDGYDTTDTIFDFAFDGRDYTNAEVVFSRRGATITGRATDDRRTPVRDYALYVFSDDRDKWVPGSRWIRMARAGADGAFRIRALPPATYWAVAVDRVDSSVRTTDAADPALLEILAPHATSVTVGQAEARDVTLRLVRR